MLNTEYMLEMITRRKRMIRTMVVIVMMMHEVMILQC